MCVLSYGWLYYGIMVCCKRLYWCCQVYFGNYTCCVGAFVCGSMYFSSYLCYVIFSVFGGVVLVIWVFVSCFYGFITLSDFPYLVIFLARLFLFFFPKYSGTCPPLLCNLTPVILIVIRVILWDILPWFLWIVHCQYRYFSTVKCIVLSSCISIWACNFPRLSVFLFDSVFCVLWCYLFPAFPQDKCLLYFYEGFVYGYSFFVFDSMLVSFD